MIRIRASLWLAVLSFSLFACSGKTVFTVDVVKSPTPSSIPTVVISTTTSVVEGPTPTAPAMPHDFTPVLYGKNYGGNTFLLLLGGVQEGLWLSPDLTAIQYMHIPESIYDVYTLAQDKFQLHGYAPLFSPSSKSYTVGTDSTVVEFGMVAVAEGWPVQQRNVQILSSENEVYRQMVLDWLTEEGITAPVQGRLHIYRVDIEGDGADEIFISATHLDASQHTTRAGDYSIVLMRKVVGNEAVTRPIVGDIYHSAGDETTFPRAYSLANFIDLNKDGVLEVVVDIQRWEKDGAIVYQIEGEDVIEMMRAE